MEEICWICNYINNDCGIIVTDEELLTLAFGFICDDCYGIQPRLWGRDVQRKIAQKNLVCSGEYGQRSGLIIVFQPSFVIPAVHMSVAMATVPLGIKSGMHAAAEEVFICALLNLGLLFYPFVF